MGNVKHNVNTKVRSRWHEIIDITKQILPVPMGLLNCPKS